MSNDLYIDAIRQITAIDCRFDKDSVLVGGIYVEAETPVEKIRLSNGEKSFIIHLPEELLHKPDPCFAWNVRFQITEDEGQEAQHLPAGPPAEP
jgi:hypothetical protein